MTIKQVPASQVDRRADRRTRCSHWDYKHDNDNDNDDDDMDMDIAARLVQRQSFSQRSHSRSQTHVGVSLSLCVCQRASECWCAQSEDKQFIVCKCLVVVARGLRSAIPAASSLWPAHLTIVNTPALCAPSSGQQPTVSKLRQQEASVRGSLLVTGQAEKPTAIAPRRNSYFRILSTMSSLPNCVQIMNTMKLQVSP